MRWPILLSISLLAATVGACGQALTSNMTGTGGVMTGTGNVTGAGGFVTGAGGGVGVTGSGGTAGAVTGSGGLGGSPPACSTLMAEYGSALAEAQACTVGASGQCQQLVTRGPSGCGCTSVNDKAALGTIEMAWQAAGCDTSISPCDAIECPSAFGFACVSTDGGSTGVCESLSGAGGVTGSGGFPGAGGVTGSGGLPDDGGLASTCGTFASEYAAVMVGARTCTPGAAAQCEQPVPAALSNCATSCNEFVTDSSVLDVIRQQWDQTGCGNLPPLICPRVACGPAVGSACTPTDGGGSICSTSYGQVSAN